MEWMVLRSCCEKSIAVNAFPWSFCPHRGERYALEEKGHSLREGIAQDYGTNNHGGNVYRSYRKDPMVEK